MKALLAIVLLFLCIGFSANAQWIRRADLGGSGRHRGTGTATASRGYIGLGHYNGTGNNIVKKDWWEYDPGTNAWTQKADYIGGSMNGNYGVLIFGFEDRVYITGGAFFDTDTYRFTPETNTWTVVATAPINFSNVDGFVIENKGYILSGTNVYEFNATTEQWTSKNSAPFNSSSWQGAFSIGEKGYIRTYNNFYEYKPSIDAWISRAQFPGSATGGSMNFAQDGKGYVVAGYAWSLSDVTTEVWQYDPFLNSWGQVKDFPGNSRRFGIGFSIGNKSYVGTGTNGTNFNDFWEFDADLIGLGIDYLDIAQVSTYPNPATEEVNIKLDSYNTFKVELLDLNGKLIAQTETITGHCKILRETIPTGTYLIKVSVHGNSLGTKKIIFN